MQMYFYLYLPQVDLASRPPTVNLDAVPREITVKAGQNVSLEIPYTAHPKPTVQWSKNKAPLDQKIKTSQTAEMCKFNLEKVNCFVIHLSPFSFFYYFFKFFFLNLLLSFINILLICTN